MQALREALARHLTELRAVPEDRLPELRYEKFRRMGRFAAA
jgi:acetyl-CoA carboxylase alpha subunit